MKSNLSSSTPARLVRLLATLLAAAPCAFAQPQVRVGQFRPSEGGLQFTNNFPSVPYSIPVGLVSVPLGNAANGLCGGMTFTTRDHYESKFPVPAETVPPTNGPLFDHLVTRLLNSFNLPDGPLKYLHLMNPDLPDHETDASRQGLAPHGRAWVMIEEEWPPIQSDLANGMLSPLALIRVKSHDAFQLGKNHQVLAYGYRIIGLTVRIYVYDPNHPNDDDVFIEFSVADPDHTTEVAYFAGGKFDSNETMNCFFRTGYTYRTPPPGATHVDGNSSCPFPNGSENCAPLSVGGPFRTVAQAVQTAPAGTSIMIRAGSYPENVVLTKSVTLRPWGDDVTIGR